MIMTSMRIAENDWDDPIFGMIVVADIWMIPYQYLFVIVYLNHCDDPN